MSFKAFISKTTVRAKSGVSKVSATVKLYAQKNNLIESINDMFDTLGKMTYYNSIGEGSATAEEDIQNVISEITRMKSELDEIENQICKVTDKRKCSVCHSELSKDVRYCPHCGTEIPIESPTEE